MTLSFGAVLILLSRVREHAVMNEFYTFCFCLICGHNIATYPGSPTGKIYSVNLRTTVHILINMSIKIIMTTGWCAIILLERRVN